MKSKIIWSCCSTLDSYTHNILFVHDIITTFYEHSNIRTYSISDRTGYTQHGIISIVNATNFAIIADSDI